MSADGALDAVIFDWGGTLAEFIDAEMLDMWRLAARHLAPDREEEVAARLTAIEDAYWQATTTDQRSGTLAGLLAAAGEALGLDVAEAVLEEAAVLYLDTWTPHIRHDPDAVSALRSLRERGLRIGMLSNTHWPRAFHEHFLERDGLVELIDARLYTSEMTHMKPHPSVFRAALDAVGVDDPARAVFVGDRLLDDVAGAKGAGLRAVHRVNPAVPAYDVEPDAVVESLPELVAVVDRWLGS